MLDSRDLPFRCTLESQNFRPPDERELTFSAYGHQGTDVCGVDLATGKVVNYSDAPTSTTSPRGSSPTAMDPRRDATARASPARGPGHVDIWKLSLDGSRTWERLTYFNKYPGYKASNPVVSDDGKFMAFQMARSRDPAGVGYGIFLYDLEKAGPGARGDERAGRAWPLTPPLSLTAICEFESGIVQFDEPQRFHRCPGAGAGTPGQARVAPLLAGEVSSRARRIYETMLEQSAQIRTGNFTVIGSDDLERMFGFYDREFFRGFLGEMLLEDRAIPWRSGSRGGSPGRRARRCARSAACPWPGR